MSAEGIALIIFGCLFGIAFILYLIEFFHDWFKRFRH